MFSEKLGWNWHKCWNLPKINIKLQVKLTLVFQISCYYHRTTTIHSKAYLP